MRYWYPTSPLVRQQNPLPAELSAADLALAQRIAREGFRPTASDTSPAPTSSVGADAEPATAASSPGWLRDAQWQVTPGRLPDLPPAAPDRDGPLSASPFERVDARTVPDARRRSMRALFLNETPQDYPSHLGPVPQGPDWEQVVAGPTPWSPLAPTARATDWGKVLTGIECRRTEDGGHHECLSPGGRRFTVPHQRSLPRLYWSRTAELSLLQHHCAWPTS